MSRWRKPYVSKQPGYQKRRRRLIAAGRWVARADRPLSALTKARRFGIASPELTEAERAAVRAYYRSKQQEHREEVG